MNKKDHTDLIQIARMSVNYSSLLDSPDQFPDSLAEFLVCLAPLNMATCNYAGHGQWDKHQVVIDKKVCSC